MRNTSHYKKKNVSKDTYPYTCYIMGYMHSVIHSLFTNFSRPSVLFCCCAVLNCITTQERCIHFEQTGDTHLCCCIVTIPVYVSRYCKHPAVRSYGLGLCTLRCYITTERFLTHRNIMCMLVPHYVRSCNMHFPPGYG